MNITTITEGYRDFTLNRKVSVTKVDDSLYSIVSYPAFAGEGDIKNFSYKTAKGAQRKVEQLTKYFHNPVIEKREA